MNNIYKISFLSVCSLWFSFAADAMDSNVVFNNQELQSSSVCRQISDQENIDPNDLHPAKKRKIEDYKGFRKCDLNPLLVQKKIEAEEILGYLVMRKKTFTRTNIRKVVEDKFHENKLPYDKNKLREITNRAVAMTRRIGNDLNGNDLYWVKIQNYQKKYKKNFLYPIIYSSISKGWKQAAQEWEVINYEIVEEDTCICGKEKIRHVARIRNRLNANELFPIGSLCINKFKSKEMTENFDKFKRISSKISKLRENTNDEGSIKFGARLFSEELINYLNKEGILGYSDCQFLLNMLRKKRKNSEQRERINKIIEDVIVPYIKGLS